MSTVIHEKVRLAKAGQNPNAICRLRSGWVMVSESQPVEGYCLLFSDPVVPDLNCLSETERAQYCLDMIRIGDALLQATSAYRINYETWGNLDPALHTHVVPRYRTEAEAQRISPVCKAYDNSLARKFDSEKDRPFVEKMRSLLAPYTV